jgi:hypothetical protein
VIHEVDEAIRTLMNGARIGGAGVELAFDAPTKEWASRRTTPTLDCYLYDIREELAPRGEREAVATVPELPPPRYYRLSYLVAAWTQRPEDEHRLLSGVLGLFSVLDRLPPSVLTGSLADLGLPAFVAIARPPADDRLVPEVWSALGGELKPSLDLVITAPMAPEAAAAAAGLVLELPDAVGGAIGQAGESRANRDVRSADDGP